MTKSNMFQTGCKGAREYEIIWDLYIIIYNTVPLSSNDDISKRRTYPKTIGPTSTCITILKSKIICCYQLFWIWTFLTPAPIMAYEKSASLSSHVGPKESTFGTDLKRMGSRKLWKSTFVTKRMSSYFVSFSSMLKVSFILSSASI